MWIKQIINYDKDEVESDVIVTDGKFEMTCYVLYCENNVATPILSCRCLIVVFCNKN